MFGLFKKKSIQGIAKDYDKQWHKAKVSLFSELSEKYEKEMDVELAKILAAQVTNYLEGEDIDKIQQNVDESIKTQISKIKSQIKKYAEDKMWEDRDIRELIVYTLRMKTTLLFGIQGDNYMNSPEKLRIDKILARYGSEFPEEVSPELYKSITDRFYSKIFN